MAADERVDAGWLVFGLAIGLGVGALVALLTVPRSGRSTRSQITEAVSETRETIRQRIDGAMPGDAVAESIAEGKAAAARRRAELGLNS